MSRIRQFISTISGKVGIVLLLVVMFILGGVLLFSVFREDKDSIQEEVYVPKTGDTWEETHQGIVTLKFADTLVIDIFTESNVISYQCSFSEDMRIKKSDDSEVGINEVKPGDAVEIRMRIKQLEEEAQERSCNNIILIKENAYNEDYLQD